MKEETRNNLLDQLNELRARVTRLQCDVAELEGTE